MSAIDWPTTLAAFRAAFPVVAARGSGLPDVNIMTPDVLGHVLDAGGTVVEVSTGIGFVGDRIFGLTWPRLPSGRPDPRDRLVHSLADVALALGGERDV